MLSLYYSINNSSNSSTVILAALAVPVAARAANPTSLLACTAVSDAVTLAVALDYCLVNSLNPSIRLGMPWGSPHQFAFWPNLSDF